MKKIFYIYSVSALCILMGCNKFLDIEPKGKVIPATIEDYHLLLAPVTQLLAEEELFLTADDFISDKEALGDLSNPDNKKFHLYTYNNLRFGNPEIEINGWNGPYANLYVYNKVINEIDNAQDALGYTEEDKKRIKSEALYGRAVQYFFLVNMFAKHYDKATAGSDAGVPILLTANTSQESPKQSRVAEVYDLILRDLSEAIPNLPKKRIEINRPSKGAGYAMLARVYLYQREYVQALKNVELALAENAKLTDYTTLEPDGLREGYSDEQYTSLTFNYSMGFTDGVLSDDMMALYDENDKRFNGILGCKWIRGSDGEWSEDCTKRENNYKITPNPLPSVAEMYVTAAECYARANRTADALQKLNELRKHRIAEVAELTLADFQSPDDLLKFALEERRRELVMNGTRLFDLKRLNLDPRFAKTVKHVLENKVYEAAPNSDKLILPIPMQVKSFNPNL